MGIISENGILSDKDYHEFKERSIRTKFAWQTFAAVGSATFFGLLMATTRALLDVSAILAGGEAAIGAAEAVGAATNFGAALGTTLFSGPGIAFLLVGVVCVYMAQRFFFESQTLDQDFQAKKIAMATDPSRAQALFQSVSTPTKSSPHAGPVTSGHEEHTQEVQGKWAEKFHSRPHAEHYAETHEKKSHERSIPKPHVDSWASEVRASEQDEQQTTRTVH